MQFCTLQALRYIPHYTYEDYCLWEGKWELIDGIPIAMSPAPIPEHQIVSANLAAILRQALKDHCNECFVYPAIDWLIKDDTVVQPDVLITCKRIRKKYLDYLPALVAEILSPSTAIKDRNAKYQIYESQGVRYYLILDVKTKRNEIYQLIDGQYQLVSTKPPTFDFNLHDNCSIPVSFAELWD